VIFFGRYIEEVEENEISDFRIDGKRLSLEVCEAPFGVLSLQER
jgi:hypothetical protein